MAIQRSFESNVAATQLTSITTEQFFSTTPDLSAHEGCHVQVEINFPGGPTDDAIVSVYAQVDGTNYDIVPFQQYRISKADDPSRVSFIVKDVVKFRVGVKRSGSTDTITSADMDSRRWNYVAS